MGKQRALLAGLAATTLSLAGVASASPLLTLQIEGSYTGAPGTYSSSIVVSELPGQTIYYEVNAIFNPGVTNSSTANSPDGVNDSINNLPNFQLTAAHGDVFSSGAMQNGFGNNSGTGVTYPNGANKAVIRAAQASGVYVNADSPPLTLETGQLTIGATYEQITGAYYSSVGGMKVSGVITPITTTSETSSDPILSYSPLTVAPDAIPEPASVGIFGFAAVGLLPRRRQSA